MKILDKVKQGLKFILKEIVSFFIKIILLLILIIVVVSAVSKYNLAKIDPLKKGTVVEIDLGNRSSKKLDVYSLLDSADKGSFYTFLVRLDLLKDDPYVDSILFKADNLNFSTAEIEEVVKKIDDFRESKKKVYVYANYLNNKNYLLAVHADEIIMPPTATAGANLTGYYSELAYYGGLAKNLGVEFNVIHVGDYKSYGENYTRKTMSKEYKENITRLKDTVYKNFIEEVAKNRKLDKKDFNKKLLKGEFVNANVFALKEAGLIDTLKYENDLRKEIKNADKNFFPIEEFKLDAKEVKNKIAVLYLDGTIGVDGEEEDGVSGGIALKTVLKDLDRIEKNKNIKGVVIRINSGGGSAFASNIIAKRVEELKKEKPVYISIGRIAASGGYYIASAGTKIFADELSITGSIGVVSLIPNFQKAIKNVGVNIETVKKGEYSDLYSMTTEFTQKDRKKIYDSSYKVYEEFLDVVAKSRNMKKEDVHKIAQGKVWLGKEAKKIGLVDEIGGIKDTIEALAHENDVTSCNIIEYIKKPKVTDVVKSYVPFLITMEKANKIMTPNSELYFKPLYYFPYKID